MPIAFIWLIILLSFCSYSYFTLSFFALVNYFDIYITSWCTIRSFQTTSGDRCSSHRTDNRPSSSRSLFLTIYSKLKSYSFSLFNCLSSRNSYTISGTSGSSSLVIVSNERPAAVIAASNASAKSCLTKNT